MGWRGLLEFVVACGQQGNILEVFRNQKSQENFSDNLFVQAFAGQLTIDILCIALFKSS